MPCTRSAKLPSTRDSSASASKSPDLLRKECDNGGPPKGFRRGGAAGAAPDVGGPCASHLRPAPPTLVSPGGGTSVYLARGISRGPRSTLELPACAGEDDLFEELALTASGAAVDVALPPVRHREPGFGQDSVVEAAL